MCRPSEETHSKFQESNQIQNGRPSWCRLDHNWAEAMKGGVSLALRPRPQAQCMANTNALVGDGVYCRPAGFVLTALVPSSVPRVRGVSGSPGTRRLHQDEQWGTAEVDRL